MSANFLPMDVLGAVVQDRTVSFGLWLPWVSAADGNKLSVKVIHEQDQFLQDIPPHVFSMVHADRPPHGDFWSCVVNIGSTAPLTQDSAWGNPGRYVYRFVIDNPAVGLLDWIGDPYARAFGVGKLSAFTIVEQPFAWSANEASWKTPPLTDLMLYEVNIAELRGDLDRTRDMMSYLRDLGINAIEIMPLSSTETPVDWGYLPVGYFGVDERFGSPSSFQSLVDIAHRHGIAVIVDVVYGHAGVGFPYYDAYTRLRFRDNPFMGPFAKDYFSNFGKSTDFTRQLTRDYFLTVNHHWLETFHVDGFRYDCVPNYWDGPLGVGYAALVFETYQLVKQRLGEGASFWQRFQGSAGQPIRLVQMAEQLEDPDGVLRQTYSNSTWQNTSFAAAGAVARGDRGRLADLGLALGLLGYPEQENTNGDLIPKAALQYFENHDHERFLCNFGVRNPDEAQNPLFAEGDRGLWFKLQPFLIALLMSKGIPMLWQGQEFAENYFLPDTGSGRVAVSRPLRWDYFYDAAGQSIVGLVRRLIAIRKVRDHVRHGAYFFFNDWDRYQQKGVLMFARYDGPAYTLVAVNTGDDDQTVPFWFPIGGRYVEELHGGALDLTSVPVLQQVMLDIPSHYGRIWTAAPG